jgi:hypothetical protein
MFNSFEKAGIKMHTTELKSCRIHHNGDYSGEIHITNEDSTSKSIGPKSTVTTTFKKLVDIYIGWARKTDSKRRNIIIVGEQLLPGDSPNITILKKDLYDFMSIVLMRRIISKVENMSLRDIDRLATFLKIKL